MDSLLAHLPRNWNHIGHSLVMLNLRHNLVDRLFGIGY